MSKRASIINMEKSTNNSTIRHRSRVTSTRHGLNIHHKTVSDTNSSKDNFLETLEDLEIDRKKVSYWLHVGTIKTFDERGF